MITDFKISTFFYPFQILKYKRFLDKAETSSKKELIKIQHQQLRKLIQHAYEFVPYYRELFEKINITPDHIKTVEDLQKLPTLTKEIVRDRFNDLISKNYKIFRPVLTKTSGSTGTPLQFYLDKNINIAKFAIFWRIWGWTGYRLGRRWAVIGGPIFKDDSIYKYQRAMNALFISSFHMTRGNAKILLAELLKFKPKMFRGYPSGLYEFVKLVDDKALLREIGIKSIVTHAETLLDFQREFLQEVFGCKVYDNYSSWEQVCIISECEYQSKHHQMEYGILEILDDNNSPVKNGEIGEITGTNLVNMAMPLIRYKTRDLAKMHPHTCKCGRMHDIIEKIDGRIEDIIITPDGRYVGRMDAAFKHIKGFDFAQIIQDEIDSINVRLVKNSHFMNKELKNLENHIRDRVGKIININFQFTEKIEPGTNGKIRFVINNINNNSSLSAN